MKSVVIYTYYMSDPSDYNFNFFVNKELSYKDNIDYIIVINGYEHAHYIKIPNLDNVFVIRRENKGFDFAGYNAALNFIESNNKAYDYYFFLNSGVIGPILPHYLPDIHWSHFFIKKINNVVKLVGTSIVCLPHHDLGGYGPKVEGFFFMTDNIGLNLLKNEKTIFFDHPNKEHGIIYGEYGLSNCILKHGYSIDCMIRKYQNINWRDPNNYNLNNNIHPSRTNSFYGESLNPYELIFHKWYWHDQRVSGVNKRMIDQYVHNNL
jgi:hypothetical protein